MNTGTPAPVVTTNQRLMQRVFSWMFAGLIMTAIIAGALSMNPNVPKMLASQPVVFWGFVIAELIVVFGLSLFLNRLSVFAATLGFFLYAALNGVTLTLILSYYNLGTIGAAFFITAGMFGVCALIGYTTKRDLSKIGSIALMLVIGLILASLVNIFFIESSLFSWIVSIALVVLFCVITAFDVQKIKYMSEQAYDEDTVSKLAIFGALMLYLDFIIIFKNLLNILGSDD
ncbi:Bax inhibitor-1/YccA family protein [Paenactinomyces guangxiensis]|uniref:Bax inhibitor-1/YccA family protein n=2 Tax=Paenactinomyces guangxiensis TaxID=1490290 RepID=A0A7W1WTX6_9BACL|nr:Bax inhibitor-1/YccA family protein [Paenactinomyces guangxiensis]MBH8593128.1 Bax inhibitor-1/YccA family protein [Paenactinomyces guangxiensis]